MKNDNRDEKNSEAEPQESMAYPQSVSAAQGAKWLKRAYGIFKQAKGVWMGVGAFIFVASLLPVLSSIVIIIMPLLVGGIMIGCQKTTSGLPMKFDYLFSGFKRNTQSLLLLSLINLVTLILAIMLTMEVSTWFGFDLSLLVPENIESGDTQKLIAWMQAIDPILYLRTFLAGILIFFALMTPVIMYFWFAPALVCLRQVSAINALKMSFAGCKNNKMAFLLYGLVAASYLLLYFFTLTVIASAAAPLMLPLSIVGYIAGFSISLISIYISYLDIFPENDKDESDPEQLDTPPEEGKMLA